MKKIYLSISLSICLNLVFAQVPQESGIKRTELKDVTVAGSRAKDSLSKVGKASIKEMDNPQSTMVIDERLLKQQQVNSLSDLLKNANGIYIMGTTGGYQEEVASRGFNITSTNTFKNGVRSFAGMRTEMSGIEKAELIKGNTAILYGNVAPGGLLNLVTKKPKADFGGSVGLSFGSFERVKPEFDLYGALNKSKSIQFRLNASYENSNSFRNEVFSNSLYLNPSLLFNLSSKTKFLVEFDYNQFLTVPDFGAGIVNYEIVDFPRSQFTGVSWGRFKANQSLLTANLSHQFNANTSINFLSAYRGYTTELFANVRPNSNNNFVAEDGTWVRNIQRTELEDDYFIQQLDLNHVFKTFGIKHEVLIGADFENFKTTTLAFNNFARYDTINIFSPYQPSQEPAIPNLTRNTNTDNPVARMGFYAQDLISVHRMLKVLVGLRYSSITSETEVYKFSDSSTVTTRKTDDAYSPKFGFVFQPNQRHSIFASYSNSFSINTGVDINGNALPPSIIDQLELGIKNKLMGGRLQLNATVYQIVNSNLAQTSLANGNTNSNIRELAGEVQSRGAELDLVAYLPAQIQLTAGYSYNETKYTKSNTFIIGSLLRYNPNHTANIGLSKTFVDGTLKNLQLGVLGTYVGERFAGRSTRLTVDNDSFKLIPLPPYFLLDATASYKISNFELRAKLANIGNVLNYNVHDDNSLNPIAPRNYQFSLHYNF